MQKSPREPLWEQSWEPIEWGRWEYADHIMLGEARVVVRLSWLTAVHGSHRLRYVGGIYFCDTCGSTGAATLDRGHFLRSSCRGFIPVGSRPRVRRLLSGRLASHYFAWPDSLAEPDEIRQVLRLTYIPGRGFGFF